MKKLFTSIASLGGVLLAVSSLMSVLATDSSSTTTSGTTGTNMSSTIIILLVCAVMYFFVIRMSVKNKKKEKAADAMRQNLKQGDRVVTIGGVCGKVTSAKGDHVTIETGPDKMRIRFARSAIASVEPPKAAKNELSAETEGTVAEEKKGE